MMGTYLENHILALFLGMVLDAIVGDPYRLPHPIRAIGSLISGLEKKLYTEENAENNARLQVRGSILVVLVIMIITIISAGLLIGSYLVNRYFGIIVEGVMTAYLLAAKSLKTESMKVYYELKNGDLIKARTAVSMIVGRDTQNLDEKGVAKAAVETVAENTSDGVIAPLLFAAAGGPVLGYLYKAVNTMDSMIGYHNDRYEFFGRTAAKTDDVVNYVPARLSAFLMIFSTLFLGKKYNTGDSIRIFRRDRYNHKSPNSAQTESVMAGALGIKLAGDAYYFGKLVSKPSIGDELREITCEDIRLANRLMYVATIIGFILLEAILILLWVLN